MTTSAVVRAIMMLAVSVALSPAIHAQDPDAMSVADLLRSANTGTPDMRTAVTRELFRRGPAVLPALAAAGAKPMQTIAPARGDVIYTLLSGLPANASQRSFGLHVDAGVTREEVDRMGQRHGFHLDPGANFNPNASPACYVRLTSTRPLADILQEILTTEPAVRTVNLNVPEPSGRSPRPLPGP